MVCMFWACAPRHGAHVPDMGQPLFNWLAIMIKLVVLLCGHIMVCFEGISFLCLSPIASWSTCTPWPCAYRSSR